MVDAMRALGDRFVVEGRFARAAECYLIVGDVASAAECATQVEDGFLTLVGTEHAGAVAEADVAAVATSPEIRLALAAARRLIETSRNLPREALARARDRSRRDAGARKGGARDRRR